MLTMIRAPGIIRACLFRGFPALSLSFVLTERYVRIGLLALFALPLSFAQTSLTADASEKYLGMRIAKVEFVPLKQPLKDKDLEGLIAVRAGEPLQLEQLQSSLQSLYATGEYSNVAVDVEAQDGQLVLRFLTQPVYFVENVQVEGVPGPPNAGQLQAVTKLRLGAKFTDADITSALENLRDLLRRNGFYDASIEPHVQRNLITQQADIRFDVDPGKRARFDGLVISGDAGHPDSRIIRVTGWKGLFGRLNWRPVTEARVLAGVGNVRQSYRDKDFLLAKVELTKLEYHSDTNTVTPTLEIEAGPRVEVRVEGVRLSKGKRRQLLPIYQELAVDKDLLNEGIRNLTDYYESDGYFDAVASYDQTKSPNGEQTITYTVQRGPRHRLVSLEIAGNHFFDAATLRERMDITPASKIRYRYGRYSPRLLAKDIRSIQQLYQSNGFRDVEVTSREDDEDQRKRSNLSVHIDIKEGPQWFVSKLDLNGVPKEDLGPVGDMLQSSAGQPYSEVNVAGDRDRLLEYYYNKGYPNVSFDYLAKPGGSHQIDLTYNLKPGPRQFVRGVLVSGLKTTSADLVDERISVQPGDPLSLVEIAKSQHSLNDLGIFSSVQSAVQNPDGQEPDKYVLYQTEEARRWSFNTGFGAQFGRIGSPAVTLDSPAGSTGFSPLISLGVNRINFLGLGHTIGLQARLSTVDQRALFSYLAPQFEGNQNLNLQFNLLFDRSFDIRTFNSERLEASVQLGQRFTRALSLQYRFSFRDVRIIGQPLISPDLIPQLVQPVRVGSFATTLIHDRRDSLLDPTRGVYSTLSVEAASGFFGSQTDFVRLRGTNSTYYRLSKSLVLARSTSFGANIRLGGMRDIPLAEHLFAGGASSNRAFPENQAGPRDPETGFPLGGNALLFNTTELRFPLSGDNLGGVLFHDIGNVYSDLGSLSLRFRQRNLQDFNYAVQGIGFGIRYKTPVGPLRLDLSLSPDSPRFFGYKGTYDDLINNKLNPALRVNQRITIFQFHFSLGQTF